MSRFGDGEYKIFASGRPLLLFPSSFVSSKTTIKECIVQAMPTFPLDVADLIEATVKGHVEYDAEAKDLIRRYNLTQLEAEAVVWWTADVSTLSVLSTEESPYHVYNTNLRARDAQKIQLWRDFSFFFISALKKLPPVETTSFRGEKKRVTELSKQYAKDNQVRNSSAYVRGSFTVDAHVSSVAQVTWIAFNSTTTDRKQTLQQFGSGGTFFKLLIRNGIDISPLSLFAGENELLLLPNSVFKVRTALSSSEVNCLRPPHTSSACFLAPRCEFPPREPRPPAHRVRPISSNKK
jgi:hypothetical protein